MALLDGVLKYVAIQSFPSDSGALAWPFALALHKNPGIVFDIAIPHVIILPLTAIVCVLLLVHAKRLWSRTPERSVALFTMAVGALGNGIDRLLNGFTTDYFVILQRSAINLADILIVAGAVGYLYYSRRRPPQDTGR